MCVFDGMPPLQGSALYDALYQSGYHADTNKSRAIDLLPFVYDVAKRTESSSVLDVGCSHGYAVERLWQQGLRASGLDLSNVAVELAIKSRGTPEHQCVPPCFTQGSATALPWANQSFDVIMSTDVLEHLPPADVPAAARELSRVAKKALVLKIAMKGDHVDNMQRQRAARYSNSTLPSNLHPTARHPSFWWHHFKKVDPSWTVVGNPAWQAMYKQHLKPEEVHSKAHHVQLYLLGRPWTCCSFAMIREARRPNVLPALREGEQSQQRK